MVVIFLIPVYLLTPPVSGQHRCAFVLRAITQLCKSNYRTTKLGSEAVLILILSLVFLVPKAGRGVLA